MNGPFGNGFPYTNFHELNMDWIIRIAKDFLDQYTHIQDIISSGETSLQETTTAGIEALQAEKTRLEDLLDAWYTEHSEDIAGELTGAITDFRTAAEAIGAEVIASIPEDYTDLSNAVVNFRKAVENSAYKPIVYDYSDDSQISFIITSGGNWNQLPASSQSKSTIIPIPKTAVKVSVNGNTTGCIIALLESDSHIDGATASFASEYNSRITITEGTTNTNYIFDDCNYLYVLRSNLSGDTYNPIITFYVMNVDDTLEIEYSPADAKAVGEAIAEVAQTAHIAEENRIILSDIEKPLSFRYFTWIYGNTISSMGTVLSNASYSMTEIFNVEPGMKITKLSADIGIDDNDISFRIAEYTNGVFVNRSDPILSQQSYIVPDNINGIRILFSYTLASNIPMTITDHENYFSVKLFKTPTPNGKPTYVAFGASTTTGSVHRFTGEGTTHTQFKYPEYVADVLGLDCINLGEGTTGFIARKTDGTGHNFMDQIYTHDTELQTARLVSIVFGYGNDYKPIPNDDTVFPIGSYDDYYPYDEDGYHPAGLEGIATMLSKGATLMGCLNWCIKWINTHYPKAQLVLVLGSPSMNEDRKISSTAQQEAYGVAPYKLSFVDPYREGTRAHDLPIEFDKLRNALGLAAFNLITDGNPITYYSARATGDDGMYVLFSTTGNKNDSSTWTWNSHPNDNGYNQYGRYIAGKILSVFTNEY